MPQHVSAVGQEASRAVFGEQDIYGPFARRFAETQTDIETSFLPDCGHVLWHDAPEAWDAWLVEGLRACGLLARE